MAAAHPPISLNNSVVDLSVSTHCIFGGSVLFLAESESFVCHLVGYCSSSSSGGGGDIGGEKYWMLSAVVS